MGGGQWGEADGTLHILTVVAGLVEGGAEHAEEKRRTKRVTGVSRTVSGDRLGKTRA